MYSGGAGTEGHVLAIAALADVSVLSYAGLPDIVRPLSGQRCSPARNGRFARPCDTPLVPASRFGLRPQGICSTYTYMSSGRSPARLVSFSQVPPRCGPDRGRAWHPREFGAVLGVSASLPLPAPPLPSSSRRYAPQCFVGGYASSPRDVSHRASDEPRRRMSLSSALAPSSLASPSIRRVFLRSFCARRRPVSSLNLVRAASAPRGKLRGETPRKPYFSVLS